MPSEPRAKHEELYRTMSIQTIGKQHIDHISWYVQKCRAGRETYIKAQEKTGVPWQVIAVIHGLEASFNWEKQILNGQPWDQVTTWVPKGYGPFKDWMEATETAFKIKTLPDVWDIGSTLYFLEGFNGYGYSNQGLVSPYIYSYTNHYAKQGGGKYVRDHVFDRNAISLQVGAAIQLKALSYLE